MTEHMNIQSLINEYIDLRNWKEAEEKRLEEHIKKHATNRMREIEVIVHQHLNNAGTRQTGISGQGVAFMQRVVSCRTKDMEAYRQYIISKGLFDLSEMKPNKSLITEMVDAGQEPPPGVDWTATDIVRFRKD